MARDDEAVTAIPAGRSVKPGTSEFARDLAAERKERRLERFAWAGFVLVLVALFIGRELSLSYGGVEVGTKAGVAP